MLHQPGARERQTPSSLIYHYTNAGGLIGILERKRIYATHYMYLNDLSEIRYGEDMISRILLEELEKQQQQLLDRVQRMLDDETILDKQAGHRDLYGSQIIFAFYGLGFSVPS
jgi:hypothetical protein